MGKEHDQWFGYTRITTADGSKKAKCSTCTKEFSNMSSSFMSKHRLKCRTQVVNCSGNVSSHNNSPTTLPSTSRSVVNDCSPNLNTTRRRLSSSSPGSNSSLQEETIQSQCSSSTNCDESLNTKISNENQTVFKVREANDKKKKQAEYDEALFILCSSLDFDFDVIQSLPFLKFLSVIDNSYKPPTPEQFQSVTFKNVYEKYFGSHHKLNLANLMGVIVLHSETACYAFSFIIKNTTYYYVDSIEYQSNHIRQSSLEHFLKTSVEKAFVLYNCTVTFTILESRVAISNALKWEEVIDNNLKNFDVKIYNSFNGTINNLSDTINYKVEIHDRYTLGDAVEDLLKLYQESQSSDEVVKAILEEEMTKFLQPVALASNYMNHRFRGNRFIHIRDYNTAMFTILYELVPEGAVLPLSSYKKNATPFCNPELLKLPTSKYWKIIMKEEVENADWDLELMAQYALTLAELPCRLRSLDLSLIEYIFNSKKRWENDRLTAIVGHTILNK